VESICVTIAQITSPHVERVWLTLNVSELDSADLASMERLLIQPQWANLRKLDIQFFGGFVRPTRESIGARLPILESRGLIGFIP
jgi:hypothetical protein